MKLNEEQIQKILSPLVGGSDIGRDMRADVGINKLYNLRSKRDDLRNKEKEKRISTESLKDPFDIKGWEDLVKEATMILGKESKDIDVLTWLIEGLCRVDGFSGLAKGFEIALGFLEQFGERAFPVLEEGDEPQDKYLSLVHLNGENGEGTLVFPTQCVSLLESDEGESVFFWQFEQALEAKNIVDAKKREEKENTLTLNYNRIEKIFMSASGAEIRTVYQNVDLCAAQYQKLCEKVDSLAGDSQPSSRLNEVFDKIRRMIKHLGQNKLEEAAISDSAVDSTPDSAVDSTPEKVVMDSKSSIENGMINSREQALKSLRAVGEYFRKNEPHSPIAYNIDKLLRWSEMSLPELMDELMKDKEVNSLYYRMTGVELK